MIDDLDYKIILELQEDSRVSIRKISQKLNKNEATIRKRLHKLVDEKTIFLSTMPNPMKTGYTHMAMISLQVEMGKLDAVGEQLAAHPNVIFCAIGTGRYDMLIVVQFPSPEEFAIFLKEKLAEIKGITKSETSVILETKKRAYEWKLPPLEHTKGRRGNSRA